MFELVAVCEIVCLCLCSLLLFFCVRLACGLLSLAPFSRLYFNATLRAVVVSLLLSVELRQLLFVLNACEHQRGAV